MDALQPVVSPWKKRSEDLKKLVSREAASESLVSVGRATAFTPSSGLSRRMASTVLVSTA